MNATREMMDAYEALKAHHREHHAELAAKDAAIERLRGMLKTIANADAKLRAENEALKEIMQVHGLIA